MYILALVLLVVVVLPVTGVSCTSVDTSSSSTGTSHTTVGQLSGGAGAAEGATAAGTADGSTMSAVADATTAKGTTTSAVSGETATTPAISSSTTVPAVANTTTSEPLYVASDTTIPGRYLTGTVLGSDGQPAAGATVYVVIDALDPLYRQSGPNLVGTASTDASGGYRVSMSTVPIGTIIDVSAVEAGYASVLMYGTYEYEVQEVDFADYGDKGGDRRLPVGDQMPPLPFEDLLPGRSEAK